MRHRKKTIKLGRKAEHRDALLANQVCGLIEHSRIQTTLAKAKAVRPLAEKMVTLGKAGTLHARRMALATLGNNKHQQKLVEKLFTEVAPRAASRKGGYTRIVKLGPRKSDSALLAFIEWVDLPVAKEESIEVTPARKSKQPAAKPAAAEANAGTAKPKRAAAKAGKPKGAEQA